MGICCSVERDETQFVQCQGHHSFCVYHEDAYGKHTCNIVYRPPYLNERLAPGEAKPRFWINPNNIHHKHAMVSVTWCQYSQPRHLNMLRLMKSKAYSIRKQEEVRAGTKQPKDDSVVGGSKDVLNPVVGGSKDVLNMCVVKAEDNSISVKMYPTFLVPCIGKPVRIRLVFMDPKTEQLVGEYSHLKHSNGREAETMLEISHLIRNMHFLKLHLTYSSVVHGLPDATLEESHGGVKRLKKVRYRPMPITWIDLDHRKPTIKVVGEQFELTLAPACPSLKPEDFMDGNGEIPFILGTYVRALDTCPSQQLQFSARLFHWFNQSLPIECCSNISTTC
ncbi:unnamed protein product [Candidula unifasciata]|uniref:Uncharacterized protein n=1 Tax=Candidula unifasciata TaxID=100452 RepID=A0A8S3ZH12_9EUPU|nr:unnamed protein product [Candidula unifasciata]